MIEKRCYSVKELQEILGVSRPSIYELLKQKEFLQKEKLERKNNDVC
ncbi:MAG: helix-turn-helix domain-containing protein [Hespellia sp.]|nr:helix-turn-helix domain-containing protein [Hespellia sp.]